MGGKRKFSGGEGFKVRHADHNAWQDAGDHHGATFGGSSGSQFDPDEQTGVILVKNTTGRDLPRFSVLTLYGSVFDPTFGSQQLDFKNTVALKGIEPTSAITGRFCVLQDSARNGALVPAMVSGITPCKVKVESLTDEFCDIETDNAIDQTRYLKSGSSGSAQIMFVPEALGEQWGVVRLGNRPPESTAIKIVRPDTYIHAAWGGPSALYNTVLSGGDVETYGNYVSGVTDVKRTVYPRTASVYEFDGSGFLVDTGDNIELNNLGALPLYSRSFYTAQQFGGEWIATGPLDQFADNSTKVYLSKTGTQNIQFGDHEFLDAKNVTIGSSGGSTDNKDLVHIPNAAYDVFVRLPGHYKVTFGVDVSSLGYQTTVRTDSAGHTTTFYRPIKVGIFLWKNFDPAQGNVVTQTSGFETGFPVVAASYFMLTAPPDGSGSSQANFERTVEITCPLADWHGGPYTRLSMSLYVIDDTGSISNAVTWSKAWMTITPCAQGGVHYDGVGMNPFLGTSGAYQWWGGGPEPEYFDKDGVAIP